MGVSHEKKDSKAEDDNSEKKDLELEELRLRKMQKVLATQQMQLKKKEQKQTIQQKILIILKVLLTNDAFQYLQNIHGRNQDLYMKIRQNIFPSNLISQLDTLLLYLNRGMLRTGIISLTNIQYLERQILGISSKITIKKRNQESTDLTSFLKK